MNHDDLIYEPLKPAVPTKASGLSAKVEYHKNGIVLIYLNGALIGQTNAAGSPIVVEHFRTGKRWAFSFGDYKREMEIAKELFLLEGYDYLKEIHDIYETVVIP